MCKKPKFQDPALLDAIEKLKELQTISAQARGDDKRNLVGKIQQQKQKIEELKIKTRQNQPTPTQL